MVFLRDKKFWLGVFVRFRAPLHPEKREEGWLERTHQAWT
jgi:hypothetical protein